MEWVRLGDVASKITKGTTPTSIGFDFVKQGINFVKAESISENGEFIENKFDHINDKCNEKLVRSQLQENDILFSIAGVIGRAAIVKKEILPANTNQALAIIRVPSGIFDYSFLLHTLKSPLVIEQYEKQKQGVAQINLSLQNIRDFRIPKLSLEDQRRIAAVLDKVTDLIAQRRAQLDKLDLLVKSRFVEMFGCCNYPHKSLIDLIVEGAGLSYGIVQPGNDGTGDMGVIRPVDLVDGKISMESIKHIDRSIGDAFKKTELTGNELLITVRGTTGITALSNRDCKGMNVTRGIAVIRYDRNKINPVYLNAYLNTDESQNYIQEHTRGATLQQINLSDLRLLHVLIPPMAQQEQFANFIQCTDHLRKAFWQSLNRTEMLRKSLMQQYFEEKSN